MFGLPGQTTEQSLSDVHQAIALQPSHLSCYQLTIEPNTVFYHQPPITPDDEAVWEMQINIQALLTKANFKQYEVSAYCLQDRQCRHNLNYWQFGDYLGLARARMASSLVLTKAFIVTGKSNIQRLTLNSLKTLRSSVAPQLK